MVRKIADLRSASDEELIADHDSHAQHTVVGTGYYLDELNRRAVERSTEAVTKLAHRTYVLTWVNVGVAVVAGVAAVIALFG